MRPPSPRAAAGSVAIGWGSSFPSCSTRMRPGRSVMKSRPSGPKASAQGTSSPLPTTVTRGCASRAGATSSPMSRSSARAKFTKASVAPRGVRDRSAGDPPPERQAPALLEQLADLTPREVAQPQMLERAAAPREGTAQQRREDEQQPADRGRLRAYGARGRLEEAQAERGILRDEAVLERDPPFGAARIVARQHFVIERGVAPACAS